MKILYFPIAVIIIGVLLFFNIKGCIEKNRLEKEVKVLRSDSLNIRSKIQTEAKIITRQVDKLGSEHVTIEATENVFPSSVLSNSGISLGLVDTVAMALNIKSKQVEELTRIISSLNVRDAKAHYVIDSLKRKTIQYKDDYVKIVYTPDTLDTIAGKFDFRYDADLRITQYYKRNWFLGAKKSYIDIWSYDNRVKINGVDRFKVEQKSPSFGLRIQAASAYHPKNGIYGFGAGARIDLGRFSVNSNYIYYPKSETWSPNIQLNYDIIRF